MVWSGDHGTINNMRSGFVQKWILEKMIRHKWIWGTLFGQTNIEELKNGLMVPKRCEGWGFVLELGDPHSQGCFCTKIDREKMFLRGPNNFLWPIISQFKKQEPFPLNNRRQEPSPKKTGTFPSGCPLLVPFPGVPAIPAINAAEEDIAFLKGKTCPWDEDLPPGEKGVKVTHLRIRGAEWFFTSDRVSARRSCFWIFFAFQAF